MIGKQIRIERIMNRNTGKTVIVPMDHGVTVGPIAGLIDMGETVDKVAEGGANAVVLHNGLVMRGHRKRGQDIGLIVHLSGSTSLSPDPNRKVLVCGVQQAVRLGADGASIHINIGAQTENDMLRDFGTVNRDCTDWGIPLLAMVYPRGPKIENEKAVENVKLAARLGAELGADIVKVPYTGDPESFRQVVEGCPVPVVIAGGEKTGDEKSIFTVIKESLEAGGAGVSVGCNVFQHENPRLMMKAIHRIVHRNIPVSEALGILSDNS